MDLVGRGKSLNAFYQTLKYHSLPYSERSLTLILQLIAVALKSDPVLVESESKSLWKDHVIIEEQKADEPSIKRRRNMVLAKADRDRELNRDLKP